MTSFGAKSLFAITGTAHILLILFALLRLKTAPAVAAENKVAFRAKPLARASTPETAALAADQAELDAHELSTADSDPLPPDAPIKE
jgi:hypothetical protein